MKESILNRKSILAVNGDSGILSSWERQIDQACTVYTFDKATTFEEARGWLESYTYDLVIVGIVDSCAFRVLEEAPHKNVPVVMVTDTMPPQEVMDRSVKAYLPKEKMEEIVPFLEGVLTHECLPGWRSQLNKLGVSLNTLLVPPL